MIDFRNYDRVRLYTHGRVQTSTGHRVGHLDDFLCMALAARFGWAQIRIDDVSQVYVRNRLGRDSYVLNVLCDFHYEPEWWETNVVVYDHHDPQNPTDRCSAHLLMEELVKQGLMREVPALMNEISRWDVIGPNAIPASNRPDPERYTSVLAAEPQDGFSKSTAEFLIRKLRSSSSLRQFIDEVFYSRTSLGKNARRIHAEIQQKREEALAGILAGVPVQQSPSGVRFAVLETNPAGLLREIFSRLGVDVIIHPNERTQGAFSVVRDSDGRFATVPVAELVEVAQERVVFQHPGGFLLVVHPPVQIK